MTSLDAAGAALLAAILWGVWLFGGGWEGVTAGAVIGGAALARDHRRRARRGRGNSRT